MEKLVTLLRQNPRISNPRDDDFADRLNSRYTVAYLAACAALVSLRGYVGSPISCWAPVHFAGSHKKFANQYCWVRNTYYHPWEKEMPRSGDERQEILYYQWIPFILMGQAFFFYLPSLVWHGLNSKAGVDSDNILSAAHDIARNKKPAAKTHTLGLVTKQIDRFLESRTKTQLGYHFDMKTILSATLCRFCGRRVGNYLISLFLISKILYIANVIGQLFVLNKILSTQFNTYGWNFFSDNLSDHDWNKATNVVFPRVTFCDFDVRRLGNVHTYTVQCVLPINLYNEKIYAVLWVWMVFVAGCSVLSLIIWTMRCLFRSDRRRFLFNHLEASDKLVLNSDYDNAEDFLDNYLRQDGAFILRLISHNTDNITTTEIICSLWEFWITRVKEKSRIYNNKHNDEDEDDYGLNNDSDTMPMKS